MLLIGGTFEFKLVDCGCPDGAVPLTECDIPSLERARDAICPATPAPSLMPTDEPTTSPMPTTSAPTPEIRPVLCKIGPTSIDSGSSGRRTICEKKFNGPVHFLWQTIGTSSAGLSDDEYFIFVHQGSEEVYNSAEQFDASSGNAFLPSLDIKSKESIEVEFDCALENPFASCEGESICFHFDIPYLLRLLLERLCLF